VAADAGVPLRQSRRAPAAVDAALTFTHGDHYKALPAISHGSHYHVGMVPRLKESGSLDNRLNDVESLKASASTSSA
jgi:hypothetical protein